MSLEYAPAGSAFELNGFIECVHGFVRIGDSAEKGVGESHGNAYALSVLVTWLMKAERFENEFYITD